jgi:succinate-semialdehyde dehydrogenase/glutarate-semialdehyde dehydrogenase
MEGVHMMSYIPEQLKADGWLKQANYINGQWVAADNGATFDVNDPSTNAKIGEVPWAGAPETGRAVAAAQAAFKHWSMTTAAERAAKLYQMAQMVRDNLDTLAAMLTLEQGKPLAEARTEMSLGADYIQWFAEEARRINGEIVPSPWKDRQILVTREPVGVVGAISPWNFGHARDLAEDRTSTKSLSEQQGRSVASADATTRTTDAAVQIDETGAAVSIHP